MLGPADDMPQHLAWSPAGNRIAQDAPHPDDALGGVDTVDVDTGKAHRRVPFDDKDPREMSWSPDGRGIFVNYSLRGRNFIRRLGGRWIPGGQIGFLSGTGLEFEAITRDASSYETLTVSSDGRTLATVQRKITNNAYVLAQTGSQSTQVEPLLSNVRDMLGLNWTADGKLLETDGSRLWTTEPHGRTPAQLLADSNAND